MFDAIVLAGGRSTRLDGADKAAFVVDGESLLSKACAAVADAKRIIIVGDTSEAPADVVVVREDPPFGGPAAAIGAGMSALGDSASPLVAVIACDLPGVERAFDALLARAVGGFAADALVASDDSGKRQTLLGLYKSSSLRRAIGGHESLDGMSVRALMADLVFEEVPVPTGSTLD
ncbi:MAG: NTP transferase domain-containing protein, partial [Aeromicrobium sp.]